MGRLYLTVPWRFPLGIFEVYSTSPLKVMPFSFVAELGMTSIIVVAFTSPVRRNCLFIRSAVRIRYPASTTTRLFDGDV